MDRVPEQPVRRDGRVCRTISRARKPAESVADGGFAARWAPDGKELYYLNLDGRSLMAVPVSTGETLKIGTERKLFDGSFRTSGPGVRPYDVMPDGKRFVMIRQDSATTESPKLIVVQRWTEELKRLVPARSR